MKPMKRKKLLTTFTCLIFISLYGEENQEFPLKDIDISNTEKTDQNASENPFLSLKKDDLKKGTITDETNPKNSPQETMIIYPIDESDFKKVFERRR